MRERRDEMRSKLELMTAALFTSRTGDLESSMTVHTAVLAPATERLTLPPEENAKETPEGDECGVGHNGVDEAGSC